MLHLPNNSQLFTKAIALFFEGDKLEARIQRHYMEHSKFDLCIDQGTQVVGIDGEQDWSKVEPGTKVVMRAVLVQSRNFSDKGYQCPRCKTMNHSKVRRWDANNNLSIDWYASFSCIRECEGLTASKPWMRWQVPDFRDKGQTDQ